MRAFPNSSWIVGLSTLVGCTQTVTPPSLQSLAMSGQVTVLCREMTTGEGRDRRACPDSEDAITDREDRHTLALVTQTLRGEVAVVDLHSQNVLDANPFMLGKEFLPVGADPVAIVSTPGGVATFVATAQPEFEAIFALPTTCITAPDTSSAVDDRKRAREISLWSACRLPGRPGKIEIISDNTAALTGAGKSAYRTGCSSGDATNGWDPEGLVRRTDCPADLEDEEQIAPAGRRKLLVTLPDQGQIAIFDAQAILNLDAGSFNACVPDSVITLSTEPPAPPSDQVMPADWVDGKVPTYSNPQKPSGGFVSRPAGIAIAEDNKLYVADTGLPLIHVVDLKDTCKPVEAVDAPLRPLDFDNPSRVVLTSEIAVSDVTVAGQAKHQRFLYAVDYDGPATVAYDTIITANSIMAFDLGDGASKAPVIRSHVLDLPFDPPDRIRFESPIKKLQIVTHDAPAINPDTKTSEIGLTCNPYPDATGTQTLYRTSKEFDKGAAPRKLRGIFGAVTLATGQIMAIDIEDWDAPCRRPKSNNPAASGTDWLGCVRDPALAPQFNDWFIDTAEKSTVTDESSCNVIEPHRLRSGRFFRTDSTLGTTAPSLTGFPRLSSVESGDLPTGTSDTGHKQPQMLAVAYPVGASTGTADTGAGPLPTDVFLNVGTTRYEQRGTRQSLIDVDPGLAEHNTLILPLNEPRIYYPQESFSATYEGTVIAERGNGWLPRHGTDALANERASADYGGGTIDTRTQILLRDTDAWFCANGVEDYSIARQTGRDSFKLIDEAELDSFAAAHADFVKFTGDFDSTDPYWANAANKPEFCPDIPDPYKTCVSSFGTKKEPKATREFIIRESQNDDLVIAPRNGLDAEAWVKYARCCFRNVASYEVRAGKQWVVRGAALMSQNTVDASTLRCKKDGLRRRAKLRSRVFEIASETPCALDAAGNLVNPDCAIGPVDADMVEVCRIKETSRGALPSEFGSGVLPADCLYDSLKGRFAIYRGQKATLRDMAFKWTVTGGFVPLTASIASTTAGFNVLPMDMVYSPSLDAFIIVDGASGGLNLIGLGNFSALGQPYL